MRLPLASLQTTYQQPRLFALQLILGNSVPPKEPPSSDVRHLPQSTFQLQSKSLTRLTTLLPFVVSALSNGCASSVSEAEGRAQHQISNRNLVKDRSLLQRRPGAGKELLQKYCRCSVQPEGEFALKPLGQQMANGARSPTVRKGKFPRHALLTEDALAHTRASDIRSFRDGRAGRKTRGTANRGHGFRRCRVFQARNQQGIRGGVRLWEYFLILRPLRQRPHSGRKLR